MKLTAGTVGGLLPVFGVSTDKGLVTPETGGAYTYASSINNALAIMELPESTQIACAFHILITNAGTAIDAVIKIQGKYVNAKTIRREGNDVTMNLRIKNKKLYLYSSSLSVTSLRLVFLSGNAYTKMIMDNSSDDISNPDYTLEL